MTLDEALKIAGRDAIDAYLSSPQHKYALTERALDILGTEVANAAITALAANGFVLVSTDEIERLRAELEAEREIHHQALVEAIDRLCMTHAQANAKLREALMYYMEQHCAGYVDCGDASITNGDCHGCVAKRALSGALT